MRSSTGRARVREALLRYVEARADALASARRELGLGEGDARALLHISDNPGIRPTQLRDHLGITSAGVTALIDRLAERGIVRREPDEDDRRVSRITLTVDLAEDPWSVLTRFDSDFDVAVDAVAEDECVTFSDLLESLTSATLERSRA
ncbi:MarR family winged helix-turn-helix transcriptional regulator [Microbacterium sp. NPDC057407]|uniref:MarR family winged helix-turn-helix transcriptional regulator n=1 Tax=Microbacterium sp. NPDC057407 TaxID=3346120 RepID=UPI00366F45BD